MQYVVDARGLLGNSPGCLLAQACRRYLLYLTIVLGVIVEELVACHHLGSGQHDGLLCRLVYALRNLHAVEESLDHHLIALHECHTKGWCQLVGILHLRHAKAGAVGSRLHKAGHAYALGYLLLVVALAAAQQNAVGNPHAKSAQIVVEYILVERHGLDKHAAGAVGQVYEVEISLHHAILAWLAMDGYIGIVEVHRPVAKHE